MTAHGPDASPRRPRIEPASGLRARVLRRPVRGAIGGLIATALMTLYRYPVFRAIPPTADFWAKYVEGGGPETHSGTGLVLHFLYGGAAGGLFGLATGGSGRPDERTSTLGVMGLAVAYGLALSVFGTRVVFRWVLDEELDPDEAVIFHAGHLVYGLTLGTWMAFDQRVGEAYD